MNTTLQRRYDIDWLRTLAFLLLIGYHIGMYYVFDWGWHIKSATQFVWLQDVMILSNQWRMSLLFFISALSLGLFQQKYSLNGLIKVRSKRLLIPLIFGMLVIVPPQQYIELVDGGLLQADYLGYLAAYYGLPSSLPESALSHINLTWNHLWFLPYLFCYTVLLLAFHRVCQKLARIIEEKLTLWQFVLILIIVMSVIWLTMRRTFPVTHDLINDWYSHGKYFLVFIAGYVTAFMPHLWQRIIDHRRGLLFLALCGYALLIADRHDALSYLAEQFETSLAVRALYAIIVTGNHWCWILTILGYAGRYLRQDAPMLRYANRAVLAWYLMHQTLIVVIAAWLQPYALPVPLDFSIILLATVLGCWLSFEIAKRFRVTRLLFGIQ
ncbi:acyltransferase family protein [Alteromonas flava]|uniref:acyltransferase family protein n=1 Tax=Alteromonas flava TaxID=2048003 RepID=UPI000C284D7A|nr:acyltransferase family protein [Alteromonas flava]